MKNYGKTINKLLLGVAVCAAFCAAPTSAMERVPQPPSNTASPTGFQRLATTVQGGVRWVAHPQGRTAVPLNPGRVIVFDLSTLDNLAALGVEAVIGVPQVTFPAKLSQFSDKRYAPVGSLFEPDYEAVNALKPDLIIVGGRSSAKYAQLAAIAPTIDVPTTPDQPIEGAISNVEQLGMIFGKEERARQLATGLRDAVQQLKVKTASRGKGLIVMVAGGKLGAYGPGSRFGVIHSGFGVPVAVEGLSTSLHGEAVGFEFILKTNPDWLFVIDRDAAIGRTGAARQVLDNPLVRSTRAWRSGQVVYLDPVNWYLIGDGIQALTQMTAQISAAYDQAK